MTPPLISGIHALMLGVNDMAPLRKIFTEAVGWNVVAEAELDAELCEHLWRVTSHAEVIVLAPRSVSHGRIHLFRFPDAAPEMISDQNPRAYGFRAMNTYARDMEDIRERIIAAGGGWGAETEFDIVSVDGTKQTVHQGRALLPDGAGLVFVRPTIPRWTAAWSEDETLVCPEATSVVVASPDADASKAFWGPDGMGLEIRYDTVQANPNTNKMIGLEPDAQVRVVFCWGETTARVEILGRVNDPYEQIESVDITDKQRPGVGLGAVGWTVKVGDMDHALKRMTAMGGKVIAPPRAPENTLHQGALVATVETPERTWLSVWA